MAFTLTTTQQVTLLATVLDRLGRPTTANGSIVWESSNPAVGTLESMGNSATFMATGIGNTTITASVDGVSASVDGVVGPATVAMVNISVSTPSEQA